MQHALNLSLTDIISYNWGLGPINLPETWHVDEDTYINGVPVVVDHDIDYGYLLEIIERDTLTLSYVVVVRHPRGHGSEWYSLDAGTLRCPRVDYRTVASWAITSIYNLIDEGRRRS